MDKIVAKPRGVKVLQLMYFGLGVFSPTTWSGVLVFVLYSLAEVSGNTWWNPWQSYGYTAILIFIFHAFTILYFWKRKLYFGLGLLVGSLGLVWLILNFWPH